MTREEQKEARRKAILLKAMELFIKKGYHETKISDIAKSVNMSAGLMFHYFESKEKLYCELVKIGAENAAHPEQLKDLPPEIYFDEFLRKLFSYAKEQPWVFQMFVLMGQAKKGEGMPEEVKETVASLNQIEFSADMIAKGQKSGIFREGDPYLLSKCFWSSVQGVMEQMIAEENPILPEPEWLTAILKA